MGDLVGLVLTHAHEDHIGAVPYLWPQLRCPLYATPFTASVLRRKLEEAGLAKEAPITLIPMSGKVSLAPFEVELITLTHSIPEPNAVVIRTPLGAVLHTGDWKLDPTPLVGEATDEAALRKLGDGGVLAMVCDSTNVFVEGAVRLRGRRARLPARADRQAPQPGGGRLLRQQRRAPRAPSRRSAWSTAGRWR